MKFAPFPENPASNQIANLPGSRAGAIRECDFIHNDAGLQAEARASSGVFSEKGLEGAVSDSALIEGMMAAAYHTLLLPLYYDACKTDERADNLYSLTDKAVYDSGYANEWDQWANIRLCDSLSGIIAKCAGQFAESRARWIAELAFLRGMVYFALTERYGGIYTDPAVGLHYAETRNGRRDLADTYRNIIQLLQMAAAQLPENQGKLRAGKSAALAMIMRVALQAAASIPDEKEAYLQLVVASGKAILQHDYAIDTDFNGMFNDFEKGCNSKEVILGICRERAYTTFQMTLMQDLVPNISNAKMRKGYAPLLMDNLEGSAKRFPTQNLVDGFLVMDKDGTARSWTEISAGKTGVAAGMYINRDKRFYASIVYDSSLYFNSVVLTRDSGNLNVEARKDGNPLSPTGYYVRKMLYETKKVWYIDGTDHFFPVLRLGEVYLNMAEAFLVLGNHRQAVDCINKTHTVHGGLPPLALASAPALWEAYKNERRVELFFENDRYWALLRWALFEGRPVITELEKTTDAIKISANGETFTIIPVPGAASGKGAASAGKFILPLPAEAYTDR